MNNLWLNLKPWQRSLALEGVLTIAALGGLQAGIREYTPGNSEVPSSTSVGNQYTGLLQALTTGLPTQISTQQTYQPQLTNLQLQNLNQELTGTPGTPGYLDLYQNLVAPALTATGTAANTATRAANVNDLATYGPGVTGALSAISPGTAALTDNLTKTATDQLALGTQLDPNSVAQTNAAVNANWANRGLGTSAPAQLDDALQLYGGGQNLLATREAAAGSAANLGYNLYTSPALSILGVNSNVPGQAQSFTGTANAAAGGAASGDNTILSTSSLDSLFNLAYNANAATNISNANNASAICGSAIGAGGSIIGHAGSGGSGGGFTL